MVIEITINTKVLTHNHENMILLRQIPKIKAVKQNLVNPTITRPLKSGHMLYKVVLISFQSTMCVTI